MLTFAIRCISILSVVLSVPFAFAAPDLSQTKTRLSTLSHQVQALKTTLYQTERSRNELLSSLSLLEKKIGEQTQKLNDTLMAIAEKEKNIQEISKRLQTLSDLEQSQEVQLKQHLQFRYQLSRTHLLDHASATTFGRFLQYYKYIVAQDLSLIHSIKTTKQHILLEKNTLTTALETLSQCKKTEETLHLALIEKKQAQNNLVEALSKQIATKKDLLRHYEQNHAALEHVLQQFKKPEATTPSFTHLRPNFTHPLNDKNTPIKAIHHGMLFLTKEGTTVKSILPGKIVFSDWLNGYGLLLIIDHGNGLMSLYAHNESLSRKKGERVNSGDPIATVGHTGGVRENGLYFELRRHGKVVPSRQWLA